MKRYVILFILVLILPFSVSAKEVNLNLFYGEECPHCHNEMECLNKIERQFGDNIVINKFEVWHDDDNADLMNKVREKLDDDLEGGVPYLVIGKSTFVGYSDETCKKIKKTILSKIDSTEEDVVSTLTGSSGESCTDEVCMSPGSKATKDSAIFMHMPILGNVNVKKTNAYLLSLLSGIKDSINFYSLFCVFTLFGLLLGIYNNKRRWILGSVFVIFSSVFYFLFGALSISLHDTLLTIIKSFISIIYIFVGAILLDYHTKLKTSKDSALEIMQNKFKKKEMLFYSLFVGVFALIISFLGINFAGGIPLLLKTALGFKNISGIVFLFNLFIYFVGYLTSLYLMFVIVNIIVKEVFKENSIGVYNRLIGSILFLVLSLILIAFPSLLMF